ncbi:MAG: hypothetical protein K0R57_2412 [Paenibacillaceae bacterium]|jgi:rhamnogalacturonyl hydrolase YesR|nr:hypothetical protein [Paenibacillaceae bacterium]
MHHLIRSHMERSLLNVANRYIGENPPLPPVYRVFQEEGITGNGDYLYEYDGQHHEPQARNGEMVYISGRIMSDREQTVTFRINCRCPAVVYVNAEALFRSSIDTEIYPGRFAEFALPLKPGATHVTVRFTKRASGFGGSFGLAGMRWNYLPVLCPSKEREGRLGWIYTPASAEPLAELPYEGWAEGQSRVEWLPRQHWSEAEKGMGQLRRLFGCKPGQTAVGWSKLWLPGPDSSHCMLQGTSFGRIKIFVGGEPVYESDPQGEFEFEAAFTRGCGFHDVVVFSFCGELDWGFRLHISDDSGSDVVGITGVKVEGAPDRWLYLGPFESEIPMTPELTDMCRLHGSPASPIYWRVDRPDCRIRPSLENRLFGKWNYPLGVTLYGLLETGRYLEREDVVSYARKHAELCSSWYSYSVWDQSACGLPGMNHQLVQLHMLDDCGSFGSALLEACREGDLPGASMVSDRIASYIQQEQSRLPDGALYRIFPESATLWADDLYMSVPFLCRYAQRTNNAACLEDAARQFIRFREYLLLPETQLLSHVYDFGYGAPTGIPWGRGNGWALFSLAELLAVLPEDHPARAELLDYYQSFSSGILRQQGPGGMWHQVLTDHESYEETSCTAMFIYALARGLRMGWLEPCHELAERLQAAWQALVERQIDAQGNVLGVCEGSWYSFDPDYYKYSLKPKLNDTHGIGIVLLAGIELLKYQEWGDSPRGAAE